MSPTGWQCVVMFALGCRSLGTGETRNKARVSPGASLSLQIQLPERVQKVILWCASRMCVQDVSTKVVPFSHTCTYFKVNQDCWVYPSQITYRIPKPTRPVYIQWASHMIMTTRWYNGGLTNLCSVRPVIVP